MRSFLRIQGSVSILVFLALLVLNSAIQVWAIPLLPHAVGGMLLIDGLVAGTMAVRVMVNGLTYTTNTETNGQYGILIPSDDLDTPSILEGGTEGAFVGFQVNGVEIVESVAWSSGAITTLNLSNGPLTITITQSVPAGVTTAYTMANGQVGVAIQPVGIGLGSTVIRVRANQTCDGVVGQAVARCFDISPGVAQPAILTFPFFQNQIPVGQNCQDLKVLRQDDTGWTYLGGVADCDSTPYSVPHTITVSGVDRFGQFIIQGAEAPTPTLTPSPTATATATVTDSPTLAPTPSPTGAVTVTATATPSATHTPTHTPTPALTPTPTAMASPTVTSTPKLLSTPTFTPTATPTILASSSPTVNATPSVTETATRTAAPNVNDPF